MWILSCDDSKVKEYVRLFEKHTTLRFNEKTGLKTYASKYQKCKAYKWLTKEKVEEYMTAKPKRLLEMHDELYKHLLGKRKSIGKKEIDCVKHIINYSFYIDQNKEMSYALAKLMNSNTCTYCNRQYTLTVVDEKKNKQLLRPEFDHWFPQSKYPDLALSYYNLIPACHYCNSSLKGYEEMDIKKHIHPYMDKKIGFHFSYVPTSEGYAVVTEKNDDVDDEYFKRVFNTLDMFKIQQVYDAHSDLELKDLLLETSDFIVKEFLDEQDSEKASEFSLGQEEGDKTHLEPRRDFVNEKCDKCVWYCTSCSGPIRFGEPRCPIGKSYKRDPPDGGYYG